MKSLLFALALCSHVAMGQGLDHILVIAPHPSLNEILGISILGVGDVNGDGWPDLAVGAFGPKKTYFYWGGPGILDTIPDLILPHVGREMRLADLNGDGKKDLIFFNYSDIYDDSVRVFFGTSAPPYSFDTTSGLAFRLPDSTDIEWQSIAVGDVNGDGFDDLVLSTYSRQALGKVCIYFGRPVPTDIPDYSVQGSLRGTYFGHYLQSADINGDGFADLAVSSLGSITQGVDKQIEIWTGGPTFAFERNNCHQTLNATALGRIDMIVAKLTDYNHDGKADLSYPDSGKALFHWGGETLSELPDYVVRPYTTVSTKFFQSGAVDVGDLNADGLHDFAFQQFDGSYCVSAYLGNIPTPPLKPVGTRSRASTIGTTFSQIVPVGDLNGDRVEDFASSAPYDNYAGILPQPGYVVVFSGNRNWVTSIYSHSDAALPARGILVQNYPNPFNGSTTITYILPHAGFIRIHVVDQLGRTIAILIDRLDTAGLHTVLWNGTNQEGIHVGTGIYFCQLELDGTRIKTRTLTLLK
jgi:hypothetical protein